MFDMQRNPLDGGVIPTPEPYTAEAAGRVVVQLERQIAEFGRLLYAARRDGSYAEGLEEDLASTALTPLTPFWPDTRIYRDTIRALLNCRSWSHLLDLCLIPDDDGIGEDTSGRIVEVLVDAIRDYPAALHRVTVDAIRQWARNRHEMAERTGPDRRATGCACRVDCTY